MSVQTFYVVKNNEGKFLKSTYEAEAGESFTSWVDLVYATYFHSKTLALDYALDEEPYVEGDTSICSLLVDLQQEEKTTDIAQALREEQRKQIMKRVMEKTPISREELIEVVDIIMEGNGKIIGSKEINGDQINILFEETSRNGWVVKRKNVEL